MSAVSYVKLGSVWADHYATTSSLFVKISDPSDTIIDFKQLENKSNYLLLERANIPHSYVDNKEDGIVKANVVPITNNFAYQKGTYYSNNGATKLAIKNGSFSSAKWSDKTNFLQPYNKPVLRTTSGRRVAKYYYIGSLKNFFGPGGAIYNSMAVINIYGRGDYDPPEKQQDSYQLIIRKRGYNEDVVLAQIVQLFQATDGDKINLKDVIIHYNTIGNNNDDIYLYIESSKSSSFQTWFIDPIVPDGIGLDIVGTFSENSPTLPSGYTSMKATHVNVDTPKATAAEIKAGVRDDVYVTPKMLKDAGLNL